MIEYIKGDIVELTPAYAVVECGGIGYLINITLPCFTSLEGAKNARLFIR
jgi:Holliday junction DNA helicase RuvA